MPGPYRPELCYVDVGGTFTDAFIVDSEGNYAAGKSPSTHRDVASGFFAAIDAAAGRWDMSADDVLPHLKVLGYGSTVVLNAILTRSGTIPGLITSRGFESILLMERGKQTWLGMDRASRLHPVTHRHNDPIVPRSLIRGVTGRIDSRGREIIPLREEEAAGGRYLGQVYGFENVITTDVGGTSFDVGLVTEGYISVNREPSVARMLLSLPMIEILSIGAGGGTVATIEPLTGRLEVGPQSAGSEPGPACFGRGGTLPTVTDADLALGYLNPAIFAGGRLRLDRAAATAAIRAHVAEPLNMSVAEAADGIRKIADAKMRDAIAGLVATRGLDLSAYHLLAFGGAGPSHVAGYTEGLNLAGTAILPFSPVFSAFGASSADYEHHYNRTVNMVVAADPAPEEIAATGKVITAAWADLREQAVAQLTAEGFTAGQVRFRHLAMLRYGRQLNDLVVVAPGDRIADLADWHALVRAFEDLYERIYAVAAKYPQAGYEVLEVGLAAYVQKIRPKLAAGPSAGPNPSLAAQQEARDAYFGGWLKAAVWGLPGLRPGNEVHGPCVIEGDALTLVVPPGRVVRIDQYMTMWMERDT